MKDNNYYLNDLAIRLLVWFLRNRIKHAEDIKNYYFDLPLMPPKQSMSDWLN